jgi:FkbH-like protein
MPQKKRRIFYQTESKRKLNQKQFTSDYRGFLLNCQLSMRVSNVFEQASLNRCAELLQRTNQLNLSGRRLGVQEIQDMLQPSCTRCYWIACNDRYGDYGLVGFCAVLKDKAYDRITDFAFSCRVAKKKFENRLFDHLLLTTKKDGRCGLIADYAPTGRNHVLLESLEEVGFKKEPNPQDGNSLWVLSTSVSIPDTDLVELILDND